MTGKNITLENGVTLTPLGQIGQDIELAKEVLTEEQLKSVAYGLCRDFPPDTLAKVATELLKMRENKLYEESLRKIAKGE